MRQIGDFYNGLDLLGKLNERFGENVVMDEVYRFAIKNYNLKDIEDIFEESPFSTRDMVREYFQFLLEK